MAKAEFGTLTNSLTVWLGSIVSDSTRSRLEKAIDICQLTACQDASPTSDAADVSMVSKEKQKDISSVEGAELHIADNGATNVNDLARVCRSKT